MNTDAMIWIIVVAVSGVLANIATVIVAFRRQPPLHQEYATKAEVNSHSDWDEKQHQVLHERIDRVKKETVSKDTYDAAEKARIEDRTEIKRDLKTLLQRTAHLAGYGEDKA